VGESVEAVVGVVGFHDLEGDDGAVESAVRSNLLYGVRQSSLDNINTDALVACGFLAELLEGLLSAKDGDTAPGENSLFDGRAAGVERVFDAGLLLFHFGFGRRADVDLSDAPGELSEPLFELLAVVIAG